MIFSLHVYGMTARMDAGVWKSIVGLVNGCCTTSIWQNLTRQLLSRDHMLRQWHHQTGQLLQLGVQKIFHKYQYFSFSSWKNIAGSSFFRVVFLIFVDNTLKRMKPIQTMQWTCVWRVKRTKINLYSWLRVQSVVCCNKFLSKVAKCRKAHGPNRSRQENFDPIVNRTEVARLLASSPTLWWRGGVIYDEGKRGEVI